MKKPTTVGEIMPSRRELLKFGGLGTVGRSAAGVWPLQVRANDKLKANPAATPATSSSSSSPGPQPCRLVRLQRESDTPRLRHPEDPHRNLPPGTCSRA